MEGAGAEMGPSGAAAVAMGLWVLVTAGVAGGPGVEAPGRCLLSQYRSLDPRALEVWERPVALKAEVALTLAVLGTMANSSLGSTLDQPLHTLGHIHSQLQACVPAQPTAGPRPRDRLHHWLHRLQEAPKKESQDCLEASVMFNLFRLLTRDLKCVASGHLCV
uniref:Interferon lambda-3-like n=1 Tax=Camelus bactrianus TaxID=9837 RepID=A0A9W3GMR6_CAMBA|nr:interferon lambda-3-like [Camelus bactrianus]